MYEYSEDFDKGFAHYQDGYPTKQQQVNQYFIKGLFIYYVRQIFWITNISYPPDTHTYMCRSGDEKCQMFIEKFWQRAK